jgi:hypothetical protein
MSKNMRWTCDGCDRKVETAHDVSPPNWREVHIIISATAGLPAGTEFTRDLCISCQHSLTKRLDPKQWARDDDVIDRLTKAGPSKRFIEDEGR